MICEYCNKSKGGYRKPYHRNCKIAFENGEKKENEKLLKLTLEILRFYPRSDNYSVDGRLVSANSVVANEIIRQFVKEGTEVKE